MSISALEHFIPLQGNEIKAQIATHSPEKHNDGEAITSPLANNCASAKDHFSLILDQETLNRDAPIRLSNCKHFTIRSSISSITPPHHNKFFIEIVDCEHFSIDGINCSTGRNMLFITDSSSFTVSNCRCSGAEGSGVIINNGHNFRIAGCLFSNNLAAGILVIGHSYNGEIRDCTCSRSRGHFNHDAGINLCSTSQQVTPSHIPERYHEPLPISSKQQRPHHILIKNCIITHCRAQGIYLEGAVNCLIEDTVLVNNNKEGICFDWGSCHNIFHRNIVSLNGKRSNLSPKEIRTDFISEYPLLEDGSSSMKLPGISMDNGCMNLIHENKITNNYGGGIKMIRTALFNNITHNQILYNAIGANPYVPYFHGITALGLGAINNEFDTTRPPLLDFMPSVLNSITDNTIVEHWQPIFYDRLSSNNFASGNISPQREQRHSRLATTYTRAKGFVKRFSAKLTRG
ncbi:MAG: right-handed parallel beta-helix repeat-containing protein [Proteobacteria bacterium]|nr:right-handed parallel beta-helix repeat-containing protein [Pseudomonadota bacterium]MBU1060703.1 right-handed parallel beta-helix repeat-containing protein [Pseudomonadota bacterium]